MTQPDPQDTTPHEAQQAPSWATVLPFPTQRSSGPTEAPTADSGASVTPIPTPSESDADPAAESTEAEDAEDEGSVLPVPRPPASSPARRGGRIPPALAAGTRRAVGVTARGTARASVATARGTARASRAAAPHAARASRFSARHSVYLLGGAWDMAAESYKRLTHRDIDERITAAQRDGEHATAAQLHQQKVTARQTQHERVRLLGQGLVRVPIALGVLAALVLMVTFLVSIVSLVQQGTSGFTATWSAVATTVVTGWSWGVFAVTTLLPITVGVVLLGLVLTGYNRRRQGAAAPAWLRSAEAGEGRSVVPTDEAILDALRHLGGPAKLNEAFKTGWGTAAYPGKVFASGAVRDGRGYHAQVVLPKGVTVEAINDRKGVLAHNLTRLPAEVWPTEPKNNPGVMDLWVADQGVLSEAAGTPPWLGELDTAVTDYFAGMPVGKDQRGDTMTGLLFEANYALAGMMGSGKSSLILDLLGGAALDPLVDMDVFVLAENADYEPLRPRLATLCTGPGEDVLEAAVSKLQQLWDELEARGQALKDNGNARKSSRNLAEQDERLRPRIVVIDECQNLFGSKKHGEWAGDMAYQLVSTARKYGVTLILATPEPSTDSLPRKMMSVISNKACFAIGDQRSSDAILGTGSYKQGISAMGLEPKTVEGPGDVGTAMARGFKAKPGLLRTFYLDESHMARVATRAMELLTETGQEAPAAAPALPDSRDVLADLDAALGDQRVTTKLAADCLRQQHHAHYAQMTGTKLASQLAERGVDVPNPGNRPQVDPEAVRTALARESTTDLDDDTDEQAG